jgi:hypothetical protein
MRSGKATMSRPPSLGRRPWPRSRSDFEKDTTLAKVDGFKMVFEHGMTLIGSREDLQARVEVPDACGVRKFDRTSQNS